ncbi:MAG: amino acid adenylation domain-containing protein [bacterium]|nr:amino acid adenylation domain-containing protein [bacterium]
MTKLERKDIEDIIALTPLQEGILFHYLREPDGEHYFQLLSLEVTGDIDREIFEKAWNHVVRDNQALRSLFRWEKVDNPIQVVLKSYTHQPGFYDYSHLDETESLRKLDVLLEEQQRLKFNLADVPFRVTLCRQAKEKYTIIICWHHILYDGWSNGIVLQEVFSAYGTMARGGGVEPVKKTGLKEFVKWMGGRDAQADAAYWRDYLNGLESGSVLSIKETAGAAGGEGGDVLFKISKQDKDRMEAVVRENKLTLAALLNTAAGVLLQIYGNTDDVALGTVVSGRGGKIKGIEEMVGLFINTLPLRVQTAPHETAGQLLEKVNTALQRQKIFENTPLLKIKEYAGLRSGDEMFDVIVAVENYPLDTEAIGESCDLSVSGWHMEEKSEYDLNIAVMLTAEMEFHFTYNAACFSVDDIHSMFTHLKRIMELVSRNPQLEVSQLDIMSQEERRRVLFEFNAAGTDYPRDAVIYDLFMEQVEKTPDGIAVIGRNRWLSDEPAVAGGMDSQLHPGDYVQTTYRELAEISGRLAASLLEEGVGTDSIVGLMTERSLEMMVGVLAILGAGGAYMPVAADYPDQRINYMHNDSGSRVLLTDQPCLETAENTGWERILNLSPLTGQEPPDADTDTAAPEPRGKTSTDAAYLIYTSGTTGRPKGVLVENRNVIRLVKNADYADFRPGDRLLQTGALEFDISTFEIWCSLLNGVGLVLVAKEIFLEHDKLKDVLINRRVTIMQMTAAMFNQVRDIDMFAGLKFLMVGGDILSPLHIYRVRRAFPHLRLINGYGPTENTAVSTSFAIQALEGERRISIGGPISNSSAYVVNKADLLLPVGVPGELLVGGEGVARGYLNRPELTAEKFIRDSTADLRTASAGDGQTGEEIGKTYLQRDEPGVLYRTGDLARFLPDGNIDFLGRIDQQVKIRGFRIELGEIEQQLLKHEKLKEAAVVVRQNDLGEKNICAYVVTNDAAASQKAGAVAHQLRTFLADTLPDYMVPAYFMELDAIPLTSNGKVDRRALPQPEIREDAAYEAPRNEQERKLVEIWADVLTVNPELIGINRSFFHLGGDSLKITRLLGRIRKHFNTSIPMNTLFEIPTIAGLAKYMEHSPGAGEFTGQEEQAAPSPSAESADTQLHGVEKREYYPLSLNQQGFFLLHHATLEDKSTAFNAPLVLPLDGEVDIQAIGSIFRRLMERHESLRTSFEQVAGEAVQRVHSRLEIEMEYFDVTRPPAPFIPDATNTPSQAQQGTPDSGTLDYYMEAVAGRRFEDAGPGSPEEITPEKEIIRNFVRAFDISKAPLIRVGLLKTAENKYLLLVDLHHIVTDGSSGGILMKEFLHLYNGGSPNTLPPVAMQYRDFVYRQARMRESGEMEAHEAFWKEHLAGPVPRLNLSTDFPRPETRSFAGDSFSYTLDRRLSADIRRFIADTGTTLYILLLTAYNILLHKLTGQTDIIIGSPVAGRTGEGLENTFGLIMDSMLLRQFPQPHKTAGQFLREVKTRTLKALEHQEYPLEEVLQNVPHKKSPGRTPFSDVALTVLNMFSPLALKAFGTRGEEDAGRPAAHEAYFHKSSKVDLTVSALATPDGPIPLIMEYGTALFERESIELFVRRFETVLEEIIANPDLRLWEIDIISASEKKTYVCDTPRYYLLSHAQKRIYYTEKSFPGTGCNSLAFDVRYNEVMDKGLLKKALEQVLKENDALRMRILEPGGLNEPCQYIAPFEPFSFDEFDLSDKDDNEVKNFVEKITREPIPLFDHPLYYFAYIRYPGGATGYFMNLHHIVSDGWTYGLFFISLDKAYRQLEETVKKQGEVAGIASGKTGDLPPVTGARREPVITPAASYIRYIEDEMNYLFSPEAARDRDFWLDNLLPLPEPIPLSYRKGDFTDITGGVELIALPSDLTTRLSAYCKEHRSSLYKVIFAAFALYLSRVAAGGDIVIGSASHNRSIPLHKRMMGMFVSTVPIRISVDEEVQFDTLVAECGGKVNYIIKNHQKYPVDLLMDELREKTGNEPGYLLDVNLVGHPDFVEAQYRTLHTFPGYEPTPLTVHINASNRYIHGVLELEWDYRKQLFTSADIYRIYGHLVTILEEVTANPEIPLNRVGYMSEAEKEEILLNFNDSDVEGVFPYDRPIYRYIEDRACKTPGSIALVGPSWEEGHRAGEDEPLDYRELNRRADALAAYLTAAGVTPDSIVAVLTTPCVEMIVALLAVSKSGGAYLPIDPAYPADRIRYMLDDGNAALLLTLKAMENSTDFSRETVYMEEFAPDAPGVPAECGKRFPGGPAEGNNLAYIIYTSGSTGRPKAVAVEHRNLTAYINAFENQFDIDADDIVIQQASFAFDAFVEELYPVLLKGGKLVVPSRKQVLDMEKLVDFIHFHKVTMITCSPLMLNQLNGIAARGDGRLDSIRIFISGGDLLRKEYIDTLMKNADVYNTYGPTESTVCASYYLCRPDSDSAVPIGKPIGNYKILILDSDGNLLPVGQNGELCIGGPGVVRGYLNKPQLTAEQFLPMHRFTFKERDKDNETASAGEKNEAGIFYRTGDRALWLPDGNIRFTGRLDSQVSVRGFRVEPGEIENRLAEHPFLRQAAVIAKQETDSRGNPSGQYYICAFVSFATEALELSSSRLAEFLSLSLPDFMIPSRFVQLGQLPLTTAGKVDRNALARIKGERISGGTEYAAPVTDTEKRMQLIWKELLGEDVIGLDDNFFRIGGHSLMATVLVTKIQKVLSVDISIAQIFKYSTLRELAGVVRDATALPEFSSTLAFEKAEKREYYPLTYNQQRLYILQQLAPLSPAFNMPMRVPLDGDIDETLVAKVVQILTIRHEALRTGCIEVHDETFQYIAESFELPFQFHDLTQLEPGEGKARAEEIYHAVASPPFQLDSVPLFRSALVKRDIGCQFMFNMHHIISDGWSIGVLKNDFFGLYKYLESIKDDSAALEAAVKNPVGLEAAGLEQADYTYIDFAMWHNHRLSGSEVGSGENPAFEFWKGKLEGGIPQLNLPADHNVEGQPATGGKYRSLIPRELKEKLIQTADKRRTSLFSLLFSAYIMMLSRVTGQHDIGCSAIAAGREYEELQHIVGVFVNSILFNIKVDWDESFDIFLERVNTDVMAGFQYQGVPMETVFEELNMRYPEISVSFNMLSVLDTAGTPLPDHFTTEHVDEVQDVKFDLEPYVTEYDDAVALEWVYRKAMFRPATVEFIVEQYTKILEYFTTAPDKSLREMTRKKKKKLLKKKLGIPKGI